MPKKALSSTVEQDDLSSLSESEYEPSDGNDDSDTPPSPAPKRQRTIPNKLKEYFTPDAESPKQVPKGKSMFLLCLDARPQSREKKYHLPFSLSGRKPQDDMAGKSCFRTMQ